MVQKRTANIVMNPVLFAMAYWLGVLFADGFVSSKSKSLQIGLRCSDAQQIYKFASVIQSTYSIGYFKRKTPFCVVQTAIYSSILYKDLFDLGCVDRKSLCLQWPTYLPQEFSNHFIRGYFDGDGCIQFKPASLDYRVSFVGTYSFLTSLRAVIKH